MIFSLFDYFFRSFSVEKKPKIFQLNNITFLIIIFLFIMMWCACMVFFCIFPNFCSVWVFDFSFIIGTIRTFSLLVAIRHLCCKRWLRKDVLFCYCGVLRDDDDLYYCYYILFMHYKCTSNVLSFYNAHIIIRMMMVFSNWTRKMITLCEKTERWAGLPYFYLVKFLELANLRIIRVTDGTTLIPAALQH